MLVAPAIGVRHPFIDRVVMLANQGNEPAIMKVALLPRQRASIAQGFEDVVKLGKRQVGMHGNHPFSERDEGLSFLSNLSIKSEDHTSELQSPMLISSSVFCLKNKHT